MVSMMTSRITFLRRFGPLVVLVTLIVGSGLVSRAQNEQNQPPMLPGDFPPRIKNHKTPDKLPPIPTISPMFSISAAPLGYGPPGPTYLGRNQNLVTLGFLDEDHLLFSFRAPGLLSREDDASNVSAERQMRAVLSSEAVTIPPSASRAMALIAASCTPVSSTRNGPESAATASRGASSARASRIARSLRIPPKW